MTDDLEALRRRHDLYPLLDELQIFGRVRDEMLDDPGRALVIIEAVRATHGVRNPAALAITRWRQPSLAPAPAPAAEPEPVAPDLDTIERAWSTGPTVVGEAILRLIATALTRHGGFAPMRESFERRQRYSGESNE